MTSGCDICSVSSWGPCGSLAEELSKHEEGIDCRAARGADWSPFYLGSRKQDLIQEEGKRDWLQANTSKLGPPKEGNKRFQNDSLKMIEFLTGLFHGFNSIRWYLLFWQWIFGLVHNKCIGNYIQAECSVVACVYFNPCTQETEAGGFQWVLI